MQARVEIVITAEGQLQAQFQVPNHLIALGMLEQAKALIYAQQQPRAEAAPALLVAGGPLPPAHKGG